MPSIISLTHYGTLAGGLSGIDVMPPILGYNNRACSKEVHDAIMTAVTSSACKVMVSLPDGEHGEIMLPLGYTGSEIYGTRCYMDLETRSPRLRSFLSPPEFDEREIDRVNAYVSPAGTGTPLHFDTRTILIVQLVGTKLWQLSKKPAMPNPHRNCVAPNGATAVDYDGAQLPVPAEFSVALLRPGDWLLVPKAVWHATYTRVGSISATLASPPDHNEL
jgi:hypothetical protein